MAARDHHPRSDQAPAGDAGTLARGALRRRLEEEIGRAERHGTPLSCLLVVIENLDEMARHHGAALREQTLEYVAGTLRAELRRFDRVGYEQGLTADGLLVILPGADGPRAEIVARRALERLRAIKVEAQGVRWPLRVAVGLAAWERDVSPQTLLSQVRSALRKVNGDAQPSLAPSARATSDASPATGAPTRGHAGPS